MTLEVEFWGVLWTQQITNKGFAKTSPWTDYKKEYF